MRRWLSILLLVLLPLQFTWAAAAGYCQHEKAVKAWHIGHHEHQHQDEAGQAHAKVKTSDGALGAKLADTDCNVCHLSNVQPLPMVVPVLSELQGIEIQNTLAGLFSTRGPDLLERPNWRIV
jgi:hypothetical protein